MSWKGWLVLIVAIWLIVASFIPGIVGSKVGNITDFLIVGILFLIASIPMLKTSKVGWVILLISIWLLISAIIPGITGSKGGAMANGLIFGILAAILAFFDKKAVSS
ncbi:MAG TPA: hypothetical protein ENF81_08280 [Thermotogaceae bacterium]|nr:hypothetical protein [Thermotogota bacterium]HEW92523.1 hypothetical protein [Thermotogaceae bacterium]